MNELGKMVEESISFCGTDMLRCLLRLSLQTFSDAYALKETMGLEVECPSKCNADSSERCYWRGTLREFLVSHETVSDQF